MRRVVLLMLVLLGGCLTSLDDADQPTEDASSMAHFDGDGNLLPLQANGTPRFHYTGFTGAEPNLGITSSGAIFATAFDDTIRSTDGGMTWESVFAYDLIQGQVAAGTNDPMLWVDTDTDRIYTNHMLGTQCFTMIWSDDDGQTWFQRDAACTIPVVDHQKVMTAPPGPVLNPQTAGMGVGGTYPNVLYTCHNAMFGNQCYASFDGGYTYTQEAITMGTFMGVGPGGDCSGVAGHPAANQDGVLAIGAGWNCGPTISISSDSGATWTARAGPGAYGVGASIDPDLAFTPNNDLFFFYRDGDNMARVARSSDFGVTWDENWNITAPGLTSTRFHVMSAGDDGRIAMAYLGTNMPLGSNTTDTAGNPTAWDGRPHIAPPETAWHLYIVTSDNANTTNATFTSYQVTPDDDPVQVGCSWESGGGGGPRSCRNLLDFIDSVASPDGTFHVIYTEGCTVRNGCAGNWEGLDEMESRDREIALAVLDDWSLYN